jgi:xanthine/uracil permease
LSHGYTRIVPGGVGFVLFVLGLFLLRVETTAVARQVAAFTLAHVTGLWLVAHAVLTPPARLVGALLALSVVYVAVENLATRDLKPWRVALVFLFGLAHGAALAAAFGDVPPPAERRLLALTSFTLGVEGAQFTVLAVASVFALAVTAGARRAES